MIGIFINNLEAPRDVGGWVVHHATEIVGVISNF